MHPEDYLRKAAQDFWEATTEEKEIKQKKEQARSEFFRMIDETWRSKDHMLPVQTVEIPQDFFDKTGLTQDEFIKSRYPGWNVEHVELNITRKVRVFVLKRDPHFLGQVVELDGSIVSREVSEYSPEIDWETLKAERPDLFEKLSVPVTTYEINEIELNRLFDETPEEAATLKRHLKVKEPSLRATARKLKNG